MLAAGNTNIPEGGVRDAGLVDQSVLDPNDPNGRSCVDPLEEFAEYDNPDGPQSVDASMPVEKAKPKAPPSAQQAMTRSQEIFFSDEPAEYFPITQNPSIFNDDARAEAAEREVEMALADFMDPDSIMAELLEDLETTPPPMSSIDAASEWSPLNFYLKPPAMPKSASDATADLVGVDVDGRAYVEDVARGVKALEELEAFVGKSPDELAQMSPAELRRMNKALEAYGVAAQEVYNEGISYGWTPAHTMEGMVNHYYAAKRAKQVIEGAREKILGEMSIMPDDLEVKVREKHPEEYEIYSRYVRGNRIVSGNVNMGISMTDLNKRDPSGNLGDAVRDRLRELTNEHLGRNGAKRWSADTADPRLAADNVSSMKGSTVAVIGVTEGEAREAMDAIEMQLQEEIDSGKILERIDPEVRKGIDLSTKPKIRVKGHYSETSMDYWNGKMKVEDGKVETEALRGMAVMSLGEDMASRLCKEKGTILVTDMPDAKAVDRATHTVFGVFKSPSPGRDKVFESGAAPEGPQTVKGSDIAGGRIAREKHDAGFGKVHHKNIEAKLAELESQIEAFRASRVGTPERERALDGIRRLRSDIRTYLETPYEVKKGVRRSNDPSGKTVLERLKYDFDRSRNVYRFRSADGEGLMVLKRGHMGEIITSRSKAAPGKQWLVAMELGKVGDYMKKHAAIDGIKDPAFAQLFDIIKSGLSRRGFDVEMAVMGGDEFLLHVMEREGLKLGDADLEKALDASIGEFEAKHPRKHTYSEKTSMPGGIWNGIRFGVAKDGTVVFMETEGKTMDAYAHLRGDPEFRSMVRKNFPRADLDRAEVWDKKAFMGDGEGVKRHDVHRVPDASGNLEMDGHKPADRELHMRSGAECKAEGAARPVRTLTAEAAYMPISDTRNLEADINRLAEGAQDNKTNGDRVTKVKRPRGSGTVARGAANAGSFVFASLGSKFLVGAVEAVAEGDTERLIESVDAEDVFDAGRTWAAMTVGTVASKAAFDALEKAVMKRLSPAARKAFKTRFAGARARMAGGIALIGGLAAAEFAETGEVDAVGLINSIALMKVSQVIVGGGAEAWEGVRRAKSARRVSSTAYGAYKAAETYKLYKEGKDLRKVLSGAKKLKDIGKPAGGPLKMLAEFVVMEGLGMAEERVITELERMGRRDELAHAMLGYDRAVSAAVDASGEDREAALAEVTAAYEGLMNAYGDCIEFEKYTRAEEFQPVADTMEEVETHGARLREVAGDIDDYDGTVTGQQVTLTEAHMRWLPEGGDYHVGQRITRGEWLAAQKERLVQNLSVMEGDLTDGIGVAEVGFRQNAMSRARARGGAEIDVPFAFQGGDDEPPAVECRPQGFPGEPIEYRYDSETRDQMHTPVCSNARPDERWRQAMPEDPHGLDIFVQYAVKKAERALMQSTLNDDGRQTSF